MKTLKHGWSIGLMLAAVAVGAVAQDWKTGYVNMQRFTTESAPAKAAKARLEQDFSKRQKDLGDMEVSIKAYSEKFNRDASTLTESQRQARQKEYADMNRDFQRKKREYGEDLTNRQNEELQAVLEKANKAVKQVAEAEKYDLVVQEAVYSSPKSDITDLVLKVMNAGSK